MSTILPAPFLFRFAIPVPHVADIPKARAPYLRLSDACRLAAPASLGAARPFAEFRAGWNGDGLAIGVAVNGRASDALICDPDNVAVAAGVFLWFDTRDMKTVHHGTRFCQHVALLPSGGGRDGAQPAAVPLPVPRARENPPLPDPEDILLWSHIRSDGYELEAWFPSHVLHGFDPGSQPRLGFNYYVRDSELGDQYLSVGPPFPVASDPSLWGTLLLES